MHLHRARQPDAQEAVKAGAQLGLDDPLHNTVAARIYSRYASVVTREDRKVNLQPGGGFATDLQGHINVDPYPLGPNAPIEDQMIVTWGGIEHELAHEEWSPRQILHAANRIARGQTDRKYSGFSGGDLSRNARSQVQHWLNVIEDGRIERLLREKTPGAFKRVRAGDVLQARWDERVGDDVPVYHQVLGAALYEALPNFALHRETYRAMSDEARDLFDQIRPIVRRGVSGDAVGALRAAAEAVEVLDDAGVFDGVPHIPTSIDMHDFTGSTDADGSAAPSGGASQPIPVNAPPPPSEGDEQEGEGNGQGSGSGPQNCPQCGGFLDENGHCTQCEDQGGQGGDAGSSDEQPDADAQGGGDADADADDGEESSGAGQDDDSDQDAGDEDAGAGGSAGSDEDEGQDTDGSQGGSGGQEGEEDDDGSEAQDGEGADEGETVGGGSGEDAGNRSSDDGADGDSEGASSDDQSGSAQDGTSQDGGDEGDGRREEDDADRDDLPEYDADEIEEAQQEAREVLDDLRDEAARTYANAVRDYAEETARHDAQKIHDGSRMIVNVQFAEGHREQIRIERPPDNVSSYYTDQVVAFRRDYAGAARRFARELQNIKSEVQADKPLQRRGRFDRRRMKQAVKGDDRVYYRRGLDLDQDIAVSIQVDRSDSMRTGGLIKDAVKAATITAMALEQSEIPYEMRSFRGKGKGHQVLHKDFGSPRATDEALGAMLVVNGWTPMKRAAEITRAAMSVREERVKLVFILADGSPNCYADGKSYTEHVRETFDAMEEMGMTPVLVYTDSEDLSSEQHELLDNTAGQGRWEHIRNPSALHRVVSNRIRDIYRNAERNR
jgi:hypothetical protein